MTSQILTIHQIIEGVLAKNLIATLQFINFSHACDFIHRGKMEQILLVYGLPIETVTAIMTLYKNTKVILSSSNGDTNFIARVLQGDILATCMFYTLLKLCTSNVNRSNKRKWFLIKKDRKQMIFCRNYDKFNLCWWSSASCKYTRPS